MKIWRNKKGIAMETAIWFILVIGVLCLLLTNLAMLGRYETQLESLQLQRRVTVDQIGEDFVASVLAGDACGTDYNFHRDSTISDEHIGRYEGGYYGGGHYVYRLTEQETESPPAEPAVTGRTLEVWLRDDPSKSTVLYVEMAWIDSAWKVTAWRYSYPA